MEPEIDSIDREFRELGAGPASEAGPSDGPGAGKTDADKANHIELGGYEIVREINRGGQAVVYQAIQRSTHRKVAIKVLLEGRLASKPARKRFEREVEIVAQLKHPSIVSIFDSGTTEQGLPYFAMDYVRGVPLLRYVRENKLPLQDTLKLFATVCEAVQYAHQKGVMHRDLKPSNILVDTDGAPKVLDFGLAKHLADPIETLVSVTGQVVGTLPYMSPEQVKGNPDLIDTRTDVYSLGVILYELLTGHYPYPVVGQMAEVLKHIAETPPTPPSRVWDPDSGVVHQSPRPRLRRHCPIDKEVETIVLKSLSKERERRYQSAGDVSRDIQHYLRGEPIEARRDSIGYRVQKFAQRHRPKLAVAAAGLVLIAGGWTANDYFQEREQRRANQAAAQEYLIAGDSLLSRGNYDQAAELYRQAFRLDPENVFLAKYADKILARGLKLSGPSDSYARTSAIRAAVKLGPHNAQALGERARQLKDEIAKLNYGDDIAPQLFEAEQLVSAIDLAPSSPLYNLRAVLFYLTNRLPEAEAAAREAVALDPDWVFPHKALAEVLAMQGRMRESLTQALEGVNAPKSSDDAIFQDEIWRTLGTIQLHLKDSDALNSLEMAREINSGDNRNWLMLARLHLIMPEYRNVKLALEQAKHAKENTGLIDPMFDRIWAQALLENRQFGEAAPKALAAVGEGDEPAYGRLIAAIAYAELKDYENARTQLTMADAKRPSFTENGFLAHAKRDFFWIDTKDELDALRARAESLLAEGRTTTN